MDFISPKIMFSLILFVAIVVYWGFNFIIIYHLTRFGIGTQPKKMAATFLMGAIIIFMFTVTISSYIDFDNVQIRVTELIEKSLNYISQK